MGWEWRYSNGRTYGPYFIGRVNGKKKYLGRKPPAAAVAAETQRLKIQAAERAEIARRKAPDEEAAAWGEMVELLAAGCLVASGFYRHNREKNYRRKRQGNTKTAIYRGVEEIEMTEENGQNAMLTLQKTQGELAALIERGQAGDQEALPEIRKLLDSAPVLWQHAGGLATQVDRRWLQVLAGDDLVAQEMWFRQLQALKTALAGPDATPLEWLLADRVGVCWLQLHDAELQVERVRRHGGTVPDSYDKRLSAAQKRFLDATKSLTQVQKHLRPKAVVNIATHQQVNIT